DRVLCLPTNLNRRDPLKVPAIGNPRSSNPVAKSFAEQGGIVLMPNVRVVQAQAAGSSPAPGRYQVDSLMLAFPQVTWAESNLRADPVQLLNDLLSNQTELKEKLSQDPASVAVAVGEPVQPSANDPHAAFRGPTDQKPRLVVFGSVAFAANRYVDENSAQFN